MLQVRMMGPRDVQIFDVSEPIWENKPETAMVRIAFSGICGGDMHPYLGESPGFKYGNVPGHEFCGVIERINTTRTGLKKGDKVAINPAVPCGSCSQCLKGRGYVCEDCNVIGGEWSGAFCELIVLPVTTLYKLPNDMAMDEACLIEPVAFAEHCTQGLDEQTVVVIGQGPIGFSCSMLLNYKKSKVIAIDISDNQLHMSQKYANAYIINSKKQNPVDAVKELVGPKGLDYVIDTVFTNWSIGFNLEVLNKGSKMIAVGVPYGDITFNARRMLCREVAMETRYLYTDENFAYAVDIVVNRKIDFRPMIAKVFPLTKVKEAFEYKASNTCLKVVLDHGF